MRRAALSLALAFVAAGNALGQGVTLPEPQTTELDNGIVFILHEKRDVPLVGLSAHVANGAITDPEGKAGLASLAAAMLEKGAGERDAAEFAEAIDAVGGELSATASLEGISITAEFLARDTPLLLELLGDMLKAPALDAREFRNLRDRRIELLRAAKDGDPRQLTPVYGNAWLFGAHPYGTPAHGSEASLAGITHRDLLAWYDDHVGADRTIISLVGDFDATEVGAALNESFAEWRAAAEPLPAVESPTPQEGHRVLLVDKPGATQSYFWIGNVGVAIDYPRRAALDVANTLFGGRFTSLLNDELRTKAGLTYSAHSSIQRPRQPGSVAIISYTATGTTIEAIDLALGLLDRLHTDGFSDQLVQSGKNYILGQFPPRLETSAQLARQFTTLAAYGLDLSFINEYGAAIAATNVDAVREVIAEVYPRRENLAFVVIGDAAVIREQVAKYGEVTEMPITEPRFLPLPE